MGDLFKLGQSQEGHLIDVGEEIKLDITLDVNPYLSRGTVEGTVIDPDGNPVEGVLVKILDYSNNPLYHTLTDIEGKYLINDIEPASELKLNIVRDGYLLSDGTSFSIIEGQHITMNKTIYPDPNAQLSTISIHIYAENGNPLENVVATLYKIEGTEEVPVAITSTNEYGQCAFMKIELGNYIGRAIKQGYNPGIIEVQVTQPGSITNITTIMEVSPTTSKGTINGVIKDDQGVPVTGATVILYEVTGDPENPILTPIRYTRTTTGGAYLFGEVPQGDYLVKSNKEQ